MKRRGRKGKTAEKDVDKDEEQNGEASDREEKDESQESDEPAEKRLKSNKRKSSSKKSKESDGEESQYEVEQVLDEKSIKGVRHYLIRWKGYEPESDTWEPESTLNCPKLIADFNATQKKKAKSKTKPTKTKRTKGGAKGDDDEVTWNENENFEVERILDVSVKKNGQREFFVSWKGYPTSQNSWEPEDNMDCKDLIKKFMDKIEKTKGSKKRR